MGRLFLLIALLAFPAELFAGEGLKHATEWVWWRDGGRIVNFLILFAGVYWVVKRLLIPALKNRTKEIGKGLEEAETAKMEAMKKLSDLEYKTRQFEQESEKLRNDTLAEGEKIKNQMLKEAKSMAERIVNKAKIEIERETQKAMASLRKETVNLSVELATKLLGEGVGSSDQHEMVEEYISSVEKNR